MFDFRKKERLDFFYLDDDRSCYGAYALLMACDMAIFCDLLRFSLTFRFRPELLVWEPDMLAAAAAWAPEGGIREMRLPMGESEEDWLCIREIG